MAYKPVTVGSGVDWVHLHADKPNVTVGVDGLEVSYDKDPMVQSAVLPERLAAFLLGIRLLRGVPLCYLVPDIALLPPESIRFFNVDRTWIDRVIDGVFSVASAGSVDFAYGPAALAKMRERLDEDMFEIAETSVKNSGWDRKKGVVTGMLIRSELARRWPDMTVKAFAAVDGTPGGQEVALLRSEPISRDLYIALFAGRPMRVEVREPFAGIRFGVEPIQPDNPDAGYKVDRRFSDGQANEASDIDIELRPTSTRVIKIAELGSKASKPPSSRMVALHLEQRPYSQVFSADAGEPKGSREPFNLQVVLRNGSQMDLTKLQARFVQLEDLVNP